MSFIFTISTTQQWVCGYHADLMGDLEAATKRIQQLEAQVNASQSYRH
jgi:hypothetical protein